MAQKRKTAQSLVPSTASDMQIEIEKFGTEALYSAIMDKKGCNANKIADMILELCNASKVIVTKSGDTLEDPDNATRLKALELLIKITGNINQKKSETLHNHLHVSSEKSNRIEELERHARSREKETTEDSVSS
jgi:hypothetical protein